MKHLVNWIEIPVLEMDRAKRFYEALLDTQLMDITVGPLKYSMFPSQDRHNAGALVQGSGYMPSIEGALIHLNATGRIEAMERSIGEFGGTVLQPRTFVSDEAGDVVVFIDTEGNRIALQSPRTDAEIVISDEFMQSQLARKTPGVAFVIVPGPLYNDPVTAPLQWAHARNMFTLMRKGTVTHVSVLDGTELLGFGLMNVEKQEAERILQDDPGVDGGRFGFRLLSAVSF